MKKVFTIGYGNRTPEEFVFLLKANGVKRVIDVRLRPDRAHLGCYKKATSRDKGIERLLSEKDIEYHSFIELGNIFIEYEDWEDRYRRMLESAGDLFFTKLYQLPTPFCLLCCEILASQCHRTLIVERLSDMWPNVVIKHL